jgi:broad specificity phosphatase PhoE
MNIRLVWRWFQKPCLPVCIFTISLVFLIGIVTISLAETDFKVTTVILVRHAEKNTSPQDDPSLNDAGKARAEMLSHMLSEAEVKAIYTTQFVRTQETAQPLADRLGLSLIKMDASDTKEVAKHILLKHSGKTVLVVGHSNTVPEIIRELGGESIPSFSESEFDNLFIVTVYKAGKAKVVKFKYDVTP